MVFACTQMGGMDVGFPDTCNTPAAGGAPAPTPLPNTAQGLIGAPPSDSVFFFYMPAHTLVTQDTLSNGDEAGTYLGTTSFLIMGPGRKIVPSLTTFIEGQPATKMCNPTGQNGLSMNAPGANLVPSQLTVMILS